MTESRGREKGQKKEKTKRDKELLEEPECRRGGEVNRNRIVTK